jgi:hypothetical protein
MPRVGNDQAGFSIEEGPHAVRVQVWGFWDSPVAAAFPKAVIDACRAARSPVHLLVDATDLKPQREEGQAALEDLFELLAHAAIARADIRVPNAITRMQMVRIARGVDAPGWSYSFAENAITGAPTGGR